MLALFNPVVSVRPNALCLLFAVITPCLRAATLPDCTEPALTTAVVAGGEVMFACDGVIAMASRPVITQAVTLKAAGRAVTLDGHGSNQLFLVRSNGSQKMPTILRQQS